MSTVSLKSIKLNNLKVNRFARIYLIACCSLRSKGNKETSFLAKYCALVTF